MFSRSRCEPWVPLIAHPYSDQVRARAHKTGDVHDERGVAAEVAAGWLAVHVHVSVLEHPVELQRDVSVDVAGLEVNRPAVDAFADVEAAFHEVRDAERVGKTDVEPAAVVEIRVDRARRVTVGELPRAVEQLGPARHGPSSCQRYASTEWGCISAPIPGAEGARYRPSRITTGSTKCSCRRSMYSMARPSVLALTAT
jgi:hypothetical protein